MTDELYHAIAAARWHQDPHVFRWELRCRVADGAALLAWVERAYNAYAWGAAGVEGCGRFYACQRACRSALYAAAWEHCASADEASWYDGPMIELSSGARWVCGPRKDVTT